MSKNKTAKWIWYPGDFEIMLMNLVVTKRYERDAIIPPFWKMDTVYPLVKFYKSIDIEKPQKMKVWGRGQFNVSLQNHGNPVTDFNGEIHLEKGHYDLIITIYNKSGLPSILVHAEDFCSDESWQISCNDHRFMQADSGDFTLPEYSPNEYRLETKPIQYLSKKTTENGFIYDFGKEVMAFVKLEGIKGRGEINLIYGESEEEALSVEHAILTDKVITDGKSEYTTEISQGFRYLQIIENGCEYSDVSGLFEYYPMEQKGSFTCSDELLNEIWDVSLYTLTLNTRELYLDGIKRDRWVWSGDAYQSYLMNYYTFFDNEMVKRTTLALRGKEPTLTHINHIMDYSFYWLIGFYEFYLYSGDLEFIQKNYDKFKSLLDFCIGRTNEEGFMENHPHDWVFVDWANLDNQGEVCFEQMVYAISLKAGIKLAAALNFMEDVKLYEDLLEKLLMNLNKVFFDDKLKSYIYSRKNGVLDNRVNKYPNMFAILFDFVDENTKKNISKNVLRNDDVVKITTPYMRFYELAAMCEAGDGKHVLEEIRSYWGAMLDRGATTFWESFDPEVKGAKQYEMYDRPFGKSLCHAWSASPVYIFGRYLLGVKPIEAGYQSFEIKPNLAGLDWIRGSVPTAEGQIDIDMTAERLKIFSSHKSGVLVLDKKYLVIGEHQIISETQTENIFEIFAGIEYEFSW